MIGNRMTNDTPITAGGWWGGVSENMCNKAGHQIFLSVTDGDGDIDAQVSMICKKLCNVGVKH